MLFRQMCAVFAEITEGSGVVCNPSHINNREANKIKKITYYTSNQQGIHPSVVSLLFYYTLVYSD